MEEKFLVEFVGPAYKSRKVSAYALAQSLLALEVLCRLMNSARGYKDSDIKTVPQADSCRFSVTLTKVGTSDDAFGADFLTTLGGMLRIRQNCFGQIRRGLDVDRNRRADLVGGEDGQKRCPDLEKLSANKRTWIELSRLTHTLDREGCESIRFSSETPEVMLEVTKAERRFLRGGKDLVLTDNESDMLLKVIGPGLNGFPEGWRFSEGAGGAEFSANVADDAFLAAVRDRKVLLDNGTSLRAVVRSVQVSGRRLCTRRTVVQVSGMKRPEDF